MFISKSIEETMDLGCRWGREMPRGQVVALTGDLGAGKTQLVKGIAKGLDIRQRVHSPTFTLMNQYEEGRLPLYHLDLYRLTSPEAIHAAGLEEVLYPSPGITVVEWAERWLGETFDPHQPPPGLPSRLRWVHIETVDETTRRIRHEDIES